MKLDKSSAESKDNLQYFLLDDNSIARWWFSGSLADYIQAEILEKNGKWKSCPAWHLMNHGTEIEYDDAMNRIKQQKRKDGSKPGDRIGSSGHRAKFRTSEGSVENEFRQ